MSNDPAQDFFSEGISEDIRNGLVRSGSIKVIARTSSLQFKGNEQDVRRIGELLNVSHVLEGSVRQVGERVRVTARLVSVSGGAHIWSDVFEDHIDDMFALQDGITVHVLRALNRHFRPRGSVPTSNSAAYAAYLEGMSARSFAASVKAFERAIALDPDYADAHASIASYNVGDVWLGRKTIPEMLRANGDHLDAALRLDPGHQNARATRAILRFFVERDFQGAVDEFHLLLSENPNDADWLFPYATIARALDRLDLMVRLSRRAVALDPMVALLQHRLAEDLIWAGYYDEAIGAAELAAQFGWPSADLLADAALGKGDRKAVQVQLERPVEAWGSEQKKLTFRIRLAIAYDEREAMKEALATMKPHLLDTPELKALIPLLYGDLEPGMKLHARMLESHFVGVWLAPGCPCRIDQQRGFSSQRHVFSKLREHRRWDQLNEKYGLDKESILAVNMPPLPF